MPEWLASWWLGIQLEYKGTAWWRSHLAGAGRWQTAGPPGAAACFPALADLRARHHTAVDCLTEVPLDREAGFTFPRKKKNQTFVKSRHWGFWLGMLWLISDSMRSVL